MMDCNTDDEQVKKNLPYCSDAFRDKLPALVLLLFYMFLDIY